MADVKIESVVRSASQIGEGAVWDAREQVLWWVDIPAGLIHRFDPSTGRNETRGFGEPVGCLCLRESGGMVLATKTGFWTYDWNSGTRHHIVDPEAHLGNNRFNDGTTDPKGRFLAGTMKDGGKPEPVGACYRLDSDFHVSKWHEGIFTPNGMTFSPDGGILYFSDSNRTVQTIWSCNYDAETGVIGTPKVFFDARAVAGRPDGGTVDADGCYWMAGVSGWQIYRITPDGKVDLTIDMPVEKPTKPMFGGAKLDILYVTSIGMGLEDRKGQPEAGNLFAVTGLGIHGIPQWRFAG